MQSIWKIGTAGKKQQPLLVEGLDGCFKECIKEKSSTLIRLDIVQRLRNLNDAVQDETIKEKALALIENEEGLKYRRIFASHWKAR